MILELTRQFIGTSTLGMVGAGHLARAIALGLLEAGLPKHNLAICHRGSKETDRELAAAGLVERVVDKDIVTRESRILLYLVRPQDAMAIQGASFRDDGIFISFLAGVPLKNLPVSIADTQCFRVMPSAPDTLRQRNGIAALYPADNPLVREILESLGLRVVALKQESDIHAFTALGSCLPIALTYWEGLGNKTDDAELLETARRFSLPSYDKILQWAHSVRPRGLSDDEQERYLTQATTPGGVTDAILAAIRTGTKLPAALERGIERSRELAGA
jgi:pyrroline-5-carboxylate reductase